jgi:hypothetical protein|tara:strand:+ start:320 stop:523 length:204 start_codon:yes stop_codon:yes gene_type:complete
METIENVEFSYGESQEYILIREKGWSGEDINLLLTESDFKVLRKRAEKMAHIIPETNGGGFLSRWFG